MTIPDSRTPAALPYDVATARAGLEVSFKDIEKAARDWGLRSDDPDALLIGAQINSQRVSAEIVIGVARHLEALVKDVERHFTEAKSLSEGELARQRVITKENGQALTTLTTLLTNAVNSVKSQQEGLAAELTEKVFPDAIRGLSSALVIREKRHGRNVEWARFLASGALVIGLVGFGYVWGTWSDWGMSSRLEDFRVAIDHCAFADRLFMPGVGRVCRLDAMVRTGDVALLK